MQLARADLANAFGGIESRGRKINPHPIRMAVRFPVHQATTMRQNGLIDFAITISGSEEQISR